MRQSSIDPEFVSLPLRSLADAALSRAGQLGAEHADFRVERLRDQTITIRDGKLQSAGDGDRLGFGIRVVHNGSWGFAAGVDLTPDEVAKAAERAIAVAKVSAP